MSVPLPQPWYRREGERLLLELYVQPGARRTGAAGMHGDRLKVRVAAPAREDRANEALIRFVAARLEVAPGRVDIVRGRHSRRKTVAVTEAGNPPERLTAG